MIQFADLENTFCAFTRSPQPRSTELKSDSLPGLPLLCSLEQRWNNLLFISQHLCEFLSLHRRFRRISEKKCILELYLHRPKENARGLQFQVELKIDLRVLFTCLARTTAVDHYARMRPNPSGS